MSSIPLEEVAEDARPLIAAFRAAGEPSFQSATVDAARSTYRSSCAANAVPRQEMALVRDHAIGRNRGSILVREYRPALTSGPQPAVLFLHGGGWVIGDLETHDAICRQIAATSGRVVLAVEYRLAPEHRFPLPLEDCAAALAWAVAQADPLSLDPARIAVAGDSAGGCLAAVLANEAELRPQGFQFDRVALAYPVTQIGRKTASYARLTSGFPLTAASMDWFSGHYLPEGLDPRDPCVSPLYAVQLADLPHFILGCGLDPLADDARLYAERLKGAGTILEYYHLPQHAHGLLTSAGKIATGAAMLARLGQFLRAPS